MIVDCHFHWPSRAGAELPDDPSIVLRELDGGGIDKAVLMPLAGLFRQDAARRDNEVLASAAAKSPDRLIPVGTTWPQIGPDAVEEARWCLDDLGMSGLKFHPWLQGFSTADETFGEICDLAGERRVPIIFHDGTPCYSVSEQIAGLARRFPGTTFILGHSGLLLGWRSALEAAKHPNIWLTMCSPHMRAIEIFCQRVDPDRLLWGSDFTGGPGVIEYRRDLALRARMDETVREKMLGGNAARLFGL